MSARVVAYVVVAGILALGVGAVAGRLVDARGGGLAIGVQTATTGVLALLSGLLSTPVIEWLSRLRITRGRV